MSAMREHSYVLGHSEQELERLARQAQMIDPITRRGLLKAGLAPGMRVLDVGSGVGDVAFLAASIAGPSGTVIGTDRVLVALETARSRASSFGFSNVSFVEGDPTSLFFEQPFDAVIGRYVLMFQPDPVALLRGVARHARSGGLVAFHEPDWAAARSYPKCDLYDRACDWIVELVQKTNARERMGAELTGTFAQAGLPAPAMEVGELIGGGEQATEPIALVSEIIVNVMPELERHGVVSRSEVGPEDLYDRILAEASEKNATIVGRSEIVGWARKTS
jgi:SAM-dependent methyltransferase